MKEGIKEVRIISVGYVVETVYEKEVDVMKKDRSSEDNLGVRNLIRRGCESFSTGKK